MQERRRYPRVDKVLPLKLTDREFDVVTETKNISGNGVWCAVDKALPVMTTLQIILLIPFKKNRGKAIRKINCGGVIVRRQFRKDNGKHAYYVGIFFNEIKEKDRKVLLSYIHSYHKKENKNTYTNIAS